MICFYRTNKPWAKEMVDRIVGFALHLLTDEEEGENGFCWVTLRPTTVEVAGKVLRYPLEGVE